MTPLTPSFREKIWGTRRLEPWFPNSDLNIGEVWFEDAEDAEDSPLLIKFIFTSEKLSVQVHPDDEYARVHHQSRGKTEMWHILAAEPGAKIAAGFRQPISRERLREASVTGEIEQLLAWHEARPGDTFFIPAGTVHAIGGGLALCEIQQRSDITYRLYDYGRPRELHLERAAEVSRLEPHAPLRPREDDLLVHCDYFVTRRIVLGGSKTDLEPGFAIVLHGSGIIGGKAVKPGEVWRLDRIAGVETGEEMTLLHVSLP